MDAVTPYFYTDRVPKFKQANAELARISFEAFRRTIRPTMLINPFVLRLTRELQRFYGAFVDGKRPKLAICTPPQHGKSIAAEDFIAWVAGKQPNWKVIYGSYSEDLGTRMSLNLQRIMVTRRYRDVFPHIAVGAHGWMANNTLTEFAGFSGSFRSTTIQGPVTGMELNLGVIDDFVKGRSEANSKLIRDKTWGWLADDFLPRFDKNSALLAVCTRWHLDDLLGRLKQKWPEMIILSFPAIAEKEERWRRIGEPLFPEHKPLNMLLDQKKVMTEASWAAEYQQHPYLTSGGMFPVEKMRVVPLFNRTEVSATVLAVDKAGTVSDSAAYTAIVIMSKMRNGQYVIERVVRGRWEALEREKQIKDWAMRTRDNIGRLPISFKVVIEQEPGSGGKESAEATIRNLAGFNVFSDKPGAGRSKEVRAEPFAAQVQGGNVSLHAGLWVPDFLEEAEAFPFGTYLDQVDAASMAFYHLTGGQVGYPLSVWEAAVR